MYDPQEKAMVPMSDELRSKFASGDALTPRERIQRDWTMFEEGEFVVVKGIRMRVHEIGEKRLVLKFE